MDLINLDSFVEVTTEIKNFICIFKGKEYSVLFAGVGGGWGRNKQIKPEEDENLPNLFIT